MSARRLWNRPRAFPVESVRPSRARKGLGGGPIRSEIREAYDMRASFSRRSLSCSLPSPGYPGAIVARAARRLSGAEARPVASMLSVACATGTDSRRRTAGDVVSSSRCCNEEDGPVPPQPGGHARLAADLCVARGRGSSAATTSSSRLDLGPKPGLRTVPGPPAGPHPGVSPVGEKAGSDSVHSWPKLSLVPHRSLSTTTRSSPLTRAASSRCN